MRRRPTELEVRGSDICPWVHQNTHTPNMQKCLYPVRVPRTNHPRQPPANVKPAILRYLRMWVAVRDTPLLQVVPQLTLYTNDNPHNSTK